MPKNRGTDRQRLRNQHGLDTERTNPSDDAEHDHRVRRALRNENSKAFGGGAAGAIRGRVRGNLFGRTDDRR